MTSAPPSPTVRLLGRDGCHLCDDARAALRDVLEERASAGLPIPRVEEVDIAAEAELERRYGSAIPVLELAGQELALATSARAIRRFLSRALDVALDDAGRGAPSAA